MSLDFSIDFFTINLTHFAFSVRANLEEISSSRLRAHDFETPDLGLRKIQWAFGDHQYLVPLKLICQM